MRIYVIAAEKSGDQHAGALVKQLYAINPNIVVRGVGGDSLQEQGVSLLFNYQKVNFMGIWEVIKNYKTLRENIEQIKSDIVEFNPTAIIHIDASGLNLRIAKFAKQKSIKRLYYIAPKIWAWNTDRVYTIKSLFDKIFVIFPFERKFYQKYNVSVSYAGNPTLEAISNYQAAHKLLKNRDSYVALLPGSRPQEIKSVLKVYASVADMNANLKFKVAALTAFPDSIYSDIKHSSNVELFYDDPFQLLQNATAAIVVSGTATLETALFNIPQVVCYKTSWLTALVGKIVIKVPFLSLVNLIAEKEVVKELIQSDFTTHKVSAELQRLMPGQERREQMLKDYLMLRDILGKSEASKLAALEIAEYLKLI